MKFAIPKTAQTSASARPAALPQLDPMATRDSHIGRETTVYGGTLFCRNWGDEAAAGPLEHDRSPGQRFVRLAQRLDLPVYGFEVRGRDVIVLTHPRQEGPAAPRRGGPRRALVPRQRGHGRSGTLVRRKRQ